ncbi:hypothetical protein [Cellulomonas sp. ATA003]|uniref:hypothetical protein n=1 Tax=Cellulomonas sp. ATA003 TaxID=3073064 RepID=UPI002872FFB0|nr:hypothetical protein [Cellulomonas sp. ATA003]WNB86067.1 hypothetical protein REH70_01900 [Cellulomonas sp. ATA003]
MLGVRDLHLEALPGWTLGVDVAVTKDQVPDWRGVLVDGFTSPFGEAPSWASDDLQNTPLHGNLHGAWPLYPNSVDDDGARPTTVPTATAFDTAITATDGDATGVTLRFSEALDPRELGLGVEDAGPWTVQWAADARSARVTFDEPLPRRAKDVRLVVFRAVDTEGNMIGGPQTLSARVR